MIAVATPTVADYFKYSGLAAAAYVRAGGLSVGSPTFASDFIELARTQSDGRLPLSIGQYLFDPPPKSNVTPWTVAYYHGRRKMGSESFLISEIWLDANEN